MSITACEEYYKFSFTEARPEYEINYIGINIASP